MVERANYEEAVEMLRAHSVRPGQMERFQFELMVPTKATHEDVLALVEEVKDMPGSEHVLMEPKVVLVGGVWMPIGPV